MRSILLACLLAAGLVACSGGDAPAPAGAEALDPAARAERDALEALAAQIEADREAVAGFEVMQARYLFEPDPRTGNDQPSVHVSLANGTPHTVVQLTVRAEFLRAGQPGAWHAQEFTLPLAGGLAPGGGTAVRMLPASDSDWALKAPPAEVEVIARVVPVALELADGRRLLTAHALAPAQAARLEALRAGRP